MGLPTVNRSPVVRDMTRAALAGSAQEPMDPAPTPALSPEYEFRRAFDSPRPAMEACRAQIVRSRCGQLA